MNNDFLSALQSLGVNLSQNVPNVNIPTLNLQMPTGADLESLYQQFLQRASQDPDIVNYYSQVLDQAKGDINIAQNFLEQDYQTGVRQTQENLTANLQSVGLQTLQENQALQDTLNRRGIALTQGDTGKLTYGGGGQAATEIGQQSTSQQLRQEALQRSAQQQMTGLQTNLQKGLTSTGQQLAQTTQQITGQKQADIANRANTYMGLYQSGLGAKTNQAIQNQQQQLLYPNQQVTQPVTPNPNKIL